MPLVNVARNVFLADGVYICIFACMGEVVMDAGATYTHVRVFWSIVEHAPWRVLER